MYRAVRWLGSIQRCLVSTGAQRKKSRTKTEASPIKATTTQDLSAPRGRSSVPGSALPPILPASLITLPQGLQSRFSRTPAPYTTRNVSHSRKSKRD